MRPFIGITCPWSDETWGDTVSDYDYVGRDYVRAIEEAGGIPILIPAIAQGAQIQPRIQELFSVLQGLYFTGGGNVRKKRSDGKTPTLYEQQPARSAWEDALMRAAYEADLPVLGACRGHQMMAVALGGEMDTETFPCHLQTVPYHEPVHAVKIAPDSLLAQIVGEEDWQVNSIHVQRVKNLPAGFEVAAWAEDGSIEAICATDRRFFLGTQFHPEQLPDDRRARALIAAFIEAAKK